jgi:hypothetical protein
MVTEGSGSVPHLRCCTLWLVVRLGLWLVGLPLLLRRQLLPALLARPTPTRRRPSQGSPQELGPVGRLVVRVCYLRGFRLPWCPHACLQQALALYYTLTHLRYPVTIHFGGHKAGEALRGHSWVTVQRQRVAGATPGIFHWEASCRCWRSWGNQRAVSSP